MIDAVQKSNDFDTEKIIKWCKQLHAEEWLRIQCLRYLKISTRWTFCKRLNKKFAVLGKSVPDF